MSGSFLGHVKLIPRFNMCSGENQVQTRSSSILTVPSSAPFCMLVRAHRISEKIDLVGIDVKSKSSGETIYNWFSPIFIETMEKFNDRRNLMIRKETRFRNTQIISQQLAIIWEKFRPKIRETALLIKYSHIRTLNSI